MSDYIFLFDLDSTITKEEILPTIANKSGVYDRMREITESTMLGEIPFKQSFLQRIDLLKSIPVSTVQKIVRDIELNDKLVSFMNEYKERCYIVTGNLDVWIDLLVKKMGMEKNVFCSKAIVEADHIKEVHSVVDKKAVVQQLVLPYVAVGDGNNDSEMIETAQIGIGYGGVRRIAPSVLECSTHVVYDEERLVSFLKKLI